MAKKYTTEDLLDSIKNRTLVPTSQITYTDQQLLSLADDELRSLIVPMMLDVRESYFIAKKQELLEGVDGASQPIFTLPERAIGNKLYDVTVADNSGNEYSLPHYSRSDSHDNQLSYGNNQTLFGFTMQGDQVIVLDSLSGRSRLNLYYFRRPSTLILPENAARITSINSSAKEIVVSSLPSTFAVTDEVDLVSASAPYVPLADDVVISSISGTTVTLSALPTNSSTGNLTLKVGDYLCVSGEAPVVQIPTDLYPSLAQAVAVKLLEGLGDTRGMQVAENKLVKMIEQGLALISPRVEGERKIIISRNNIKSYLSYKYPRRY